MEYELFDFRDALSLVKTKQEYRDTWLELINTIKNISDDDIISHYENYCKSSMSISKSINSLIKNRLVTKNWKEESPIFQDSEFQGKRWRLDFAKDTIAVEVAFNHGEAIAWNLIKPVLASELNHVKKAIQTKLGVIITATKEMKIAGAFDGAAGEYEKFIRYLDPFRNILTVPMIIVGLKAPKTFYVKKRKEGRRNFGFIVPIDKK